MGCSLDFWGDLTHSLFSASERLLEFSVVNVLTFPMK
jgi:hypothetical protein